jgi:hypothetical protein
MNSLQNDGKNFRVKGVQPCHMHDDPKFYEMMNLYDEHKIVKMGSISPQHSVHSGIMRDVMLQAAGQGPENYSQDTLAKVGVVRVLRVSLYV